MLKIALTGNIASGKSSVQLFLEEKSYPVLDTDIVCHELLENSVEIAEAFSEYDVFHDGESHIQIVQMQLRSTRGSFSFILKGKASIDDDENKFIDYKEQRICLDEEIQTFYFDEGIKKSFWKNLKESILLEPNFNGMGIDLKKLLKSLRK